MEWLDDFRGGKGESALVDISLERDSDLLLKLPGELCRRIDESSMKKELANSAIGTKFAARIVGCCFEGIRNGVDRRNNKRQ